MVEWDIGLWDSKRREFVRDKRWKSGEVPSMPGGLLSLYGSIRERNLRHSKILEDMKANRLSAKEIKMAYYDLARSCGLAPD